MGRAANRFGHRQGARNPKRLILACADYAEHKATDAPRELEIWFDWSSFNLPYTAGGQADQPYALMRRIRAARNVYEAMHTLRTTKDWGRMQEQNPGAWEIVEMVTRLREDIAYGR
jgi:hypothetical protein